MGGFFSSGSLFILLLSLSSAAKIPSLSSAILQSQPLAESHNNKGKPSLSCGLCTVIVDTVRYMISQEKDEAAIDEFLRRSCITLNIEQKHVCDTIIKAFSNEAYFVLERALFTPEEICGMFLPDCGTPVNPLHIQWPLDIPKAKPPLRPWPVIPEGKPTVRVLHLSDIHVDRDYAEGSEADCQRDNWLSSYALCCRNYPDSTASEKVKYPAGKWGSPFNCDIPFRTFESAIQYIAQTQTKLDWVIVTGDKEAHDMWDYTKEKTEKNIANITETLLHYFPGVKIYEAVGNHEGVPMDAMAPHTMEQYDTRGPQWLYDLLAEKWSQWISPEAQLSVKFRASYVEYPLPGLKLISLNTIYCSTFNFYLYINQTDPDGTLAWLVEQLLDSEERGEKVHIISHIPAGDNYCLKGWAHNFYEIVNRFENTIAGQFYGHTHNDHFEVYYEDSNPSGRPTHFNFISPSVTTYTDNNPSFRIYTIDAGYYGATATVKDAETYSADVAEANESGRDLEWKLLYSTKEAYGMKDLSPASWHNLIERMSMDPTLFRSFHQHYYRRTDYEVECWEEEECRKKYICPLRAAKSYELDHFCT